MNIEKLETLPSRQSKWQYLSEKIGTAWNRKSHYSKQKDLWLIADRVCKSFIGKKWDDAFAYYCKLVPKGTENRYEAFCSRFNSIPRYRRWEEWFVEDGIIVHKPYIRPKTITIRSLDYKTELLHKETLTPLPQFYWIHKNLTKEYIDKNYAYFILKGWERTFSSKNDPTYKKLYKEQQDAIRKNDRLLKKEKEEKEYDMLSRSEIKMLEEKEKNSIHIQRLGFDEATSFRNNSVYVKK